MKRRLLTALSATTFVLVSCAGTDYAATYTGIANKMNCAVEHPLFFWNFPAMDPDYEEEWEEWVWADVQIEMANAKQVLRDVIEDIVAVNWPDYVDGDVNQLITELATAVESLERLSEAETLDEFFLAIDIYEPLFSNVTANDILRVKLGVTDEQLLDDYDLNETCAWGW